MNELIYWLIKLFKKKKTEKTDRHDFYLNRIYFKRIGLLYNLFDAKKSAGQLSITQESIKPLGLKFGDDSDTVLKALGKPNFVYDNCNNKHNHKALIFRKTISQINLMIQLQFYNNKLFFIAYDVAKSIKNVTQKFEVVNTVIEKYLSTPFQPGEYPVIQDKAGNFITINEDVNFSICYLDGEHPEVRSFIEEGIKDPSKAKPEKKDKEKLFYAF